nr:hypothetical protein [Tanacetum cinerariifolium]
RIGDGEKDSIAASEFAETNSSSGRGEELSYNNFSIRRMSSSKSQSVSSIPGGIDLRRVSSPANSSKRESIIDEIGREESWVRRDSIRSDSALSGCRSIFIGMISSSIRASKRTFENVVNSDKELSKLLVSSKRELREVEEDLEQWDYLSTHPSKRLNSFCYDDDDEEDYTLAVTPSLSTEEPDNSLSMVDEHLDTIPATESDEVIKSSVEDLIPIPSESEGIPDHMCDVPFHDNSPPLDVSKDQFEDFFESNDEFSSIDDDSFSFEKIDYVEVSPLDSELVSSKVMEIVIPEVDAFLAVEDEPTSSQFPQLYLDPEGDILLLEAFLNDDHSFDFKTNDDQSCSDEDVLEKIILKPLIEEEIIPMNIDLHPDNAESDLMESLRTHDSSLPISSMIDSLLDEFAGELTLLKSIPPGIDETDCDFEEDIRLIEKLLYDNSSPRPLEEFVSANSDAAIESFSPSPILVKDNDSLMEEIDLFCERKTRKGQNQIKTGQKREAWRSPAVSKAITVNKARKKIKKIQVEGPKMQNPTKLYSMKNKARD